MPPPVETPPEMVSTFVRYFYRHIREKVSLCRAPFAPSCIMHACTRHEDC